MATITDLAAADSGATSRTTINDNFDNLNNDKAESSTLTAHTGASTNVHGLTSGAAVVGDTSTQTLTNKTLTSPTLTTPTIASFANATHNHTNAAGGGQLTDAVLSAAVTVAKGGTGQTSLTAYAPIFGGTTGTGAVQSGTVGSSGQVLTSNGAGALPTFQAPSSGVFACGQTSRTAGAGTGTQNIAHGLAVTPKLVKITAMTNAATNDISISVGSATSTSNETCTYWSQNAGGSDEVSQNNAAIINLKDGATNRFIATLSALDSTNITLDFTTNSGTNPCLIQWEAIA